ncbi:MAG: methyltransferase domain-containing protein [Planctomycetota bacterium]|nr:methyltransferase domain-containing protein [Planctomycetota bacterium]
MRNRKLTDAEQAVIRDFRARRIVDSDRPEPLVRTLAQFRHTLIQAVFGALGRVVDAGCGVGTTVEEFRRLGTDCLGFDGCTDLNRLASPTLSSHLRSGRFDAFPYSAEDAIRTVVAFDSIENASLDELSQVPTELQRLGVQQVALSVGRNPITKGRLSLQDRDFYTDLMAQAGLRLMEEWTPLLSDVRVPSSWNAILQRVEWTDIGSTGDPANAWNNAPGYLFFQRNRPRP